MDLTLFAQDIQKKPAATLLILVTVAAGLVITFLLMLIYMSDKSIDRSMPDSHRIYRIESQFNLPGGDAVRSAQVPLPLVSSLRKHTDIESVGYAFRTEATLHHQGKSAVVNNLLTVTPDFISQLQPWQERLPAPQQNEMYITADFNRQYLQLDNPAGKVIDLGERGQFLIKAVVTPRPDSSLKLAAAIAFSPQRVTDYNEKRQEWYDTNAYVFVKLKPSVKNFNPHIFTEIIQNDVPPLSGAPFTPASFFQFRANPVVDMHYDQEYADEIVTTTDRSLLCTLYAAAIFIIIATVTNYFNLSGVLNEARYPGQQIKSSLGASSKQLLREVFWALLVQLVIASVLSLVCLFIVINIFSQISQLLNRASTLSPFLLYASSILLIATLMFSVTLLNPASFGFAHSSFGRPNRYKNRKIIYLNRTIMTVQLIMAGTAIFLWAGVTDHNALTARTDIGYQKSHRLTFPIDKETFSLTSLRLLQHQLQAQMQTSAISLASWQPFSMSRHVMNIQHDRQSVKKQFTAISIITADKNFVEVWGLTPLAGLENILQPSTDEKVINAIATRQFMHVMGKENFEALLSADYYVPSSEHQQQIRILQVVDDFYLGESLSKPQPLLILLNDSLERFATLSYPDKTDSEEIISLIKSYTSAELAVQSVQALHNKHFDAQRQVLNIIKLTAIITLILVVISTLIISLSEAQRLNKTIIIMMAIGGSIATSLVFFLQQNKVSIILSFFAALTTGYTILHSQLHYSQPFVISVYLHASAALLLFYLMIIASMSLAFILSTVKKTATELNQY